MKGERNTKSGAHDRSWELDRELNKGTNVNDIQI